MEIRIKYGGVLSLFVKFSRSKKIRFLNFHIFKKKGKSAKIKKLREKNMENMGKNSPIRTTLKGGTVASKNPADTLT